MSLEEIARFNDVYEADLAAAFLESHGIPVSVTERFQTTVDPLMQRALGIRLMTPASELGRARELLERARAGEFASDEGDDDLVAPNNRTKVAGVAMALAAAATGGFWGTSLPRRFRPLAWQGMLLAGALVGGAFAVAALIVELIRNPA